MKELIEKQKEEYIARFVSLSGMEDGMPISKEIYNWHINSIKEILEAEVKRKQKDLVKYNELDSELHDFSESIGITEHDIEHLTNIISNLK